MLMKALLRPIKRGKREKLQAVGLSITKLLAIGAKVQVMHQKPNHAF